jgi:beta-carotene 3-hydroxylase
MHPVLVALVGFLLMEPITALVHRAVMHGPGIVLHRSHHRRVRPGESPRRWEANDLFPVAFAAVVMLGFAIGFNVAGYEVLVPIGIGITLYGLAYAVVHDAYIHRRLPLFGDRTVPLLERLAVAHRRHHDRNGAPYGMLIPLPVRADGGSGRGTRDGQRMRSGSRPSHDPADA